MNSNIAGIYEGAKPVIPETTLLLCSYILLVGTAEVIVIHLLGLAPEVWLASPDIRA
jgi:hypothetical protein